MKLDLAVCILFLERVEQTLDCVRSFCGTDHVVYLLNNGSSLESRRRLVEGCAGLPNIVLLDSPRNLGVSGGRNRLIAAASAAWLFFADSDITVEGTRWRSDIEAEVRRFPDAEAFIPRLYNVHEGKEAIPQYMVLRGRKMHTSPLPGREVTNLFPGGAALVKRSLFDRIGPYDDSMKVGFEDFELALRAIKGGAPIRARRIESVRLLHEHRTPATPGDLEAARTRYSAHTILVSYLHFTRKHRVIHAPTWISWIRRQRREMKADDIGIVTTAILVLRILWQQWLLGSRLDWCRDGTLARLFK